MSKTEAQPTEAEKLYNQHIADLHREAQGYIKRQNWHGLDCVNNALVAQGVKPIPNPPERKPAGNTGSSKGGAKSSK